MKSCNKKEGTHEDLNTTLSLLYNVITSSRHKISRVNKITLVITRFCSQREFSSISVVPPSSLFP